MTKSDSSKELAGIALDFQTLSEQQRKELKIGLSHKPLSQLSESEVAELFETLKSRFQKHGRQKPKENKPAQSNAGYDKCYTPPHAIYPLIPFIPRDWQIWESACGQGHLSRALIQAGRRTIGTDIESGHDFFKWQPGIPWHAQITNPPYSMKYQWIERSYALRKPFALLMPLETLGAAKRQALFKEHGMQLMVLNRRINFHMPKAGWSGKGAQFPVAWFTWQFNLPRDIVYVDVPSDPFTMVMDFGQESAT